MQNILEADELMEIKSLTKYSLKINDELESMGLKKVRANLIHQVIGGFHRHTDIEIAGKRVLNRYNSLLTQNNLEKATSNEEA